jgi:hypothetical protein
MYFRFLHLNSTTTDINTNCLHITQVMLYMRIKKNIYTIRIEKIFSWPVQAGMHRVVDCSSAQSRKYSKILDNGTYDIWECMRLHLECANFAYSMELLQNLKVVTRGPTPLLPTRGNVKLSFFFLLFWNFHSMILFQTAQNLMPRP